MNATTQLNILIQYSIFKTWTSTYFRVPLDYLEVKLVFSQQGVNLGTCVDSILRNFLLMLSQSLLERWLPVIYNSH